MAEQQLHRVVACRASRDYQLHLRFADGLAGAVYLGNLLDLGAFRLWRDLRAFLIVHPDPESGSVCWPVGVRLDPEVLWNDISIRYEARRRAIAKDVAWQRFWTKVLTPLKRKGRR